MPPGPVKTADLYQFGENFECDLRAYELRSGGTPLKLKPLQMELLLLLIERRGELVTRDQIVERLWGKGVFLDTDNSINGAISRIRQVLRDNTENPRFVKTVSGRGYRFISPVVEVDRQPSDSIVGPPVAAAPTPVPKLAPFRSFLLRWAALFLILLFLVAASFWWRHRRGNTAEATQRVMLAVLPFENLTGDPGQDYFVDGVTEEMITQLGQLDARQIGVIARTSVMHYKGNRSTLDQIARELHADYLLEGSVRRDARQVRITAQLIRIKDQSHLWARDYDRESKDLLTLQSEIAGEVASEIGRRLSSPRAPQAVQFPASNNAEAYELYLKGRYAWNKRTGQSLLQAIAYFDEAIAKDPSYARTYAAQAQCYALLGGYLAAPQDEYISKARAAATHALKRDERLPEAHTALALVAQNYDHDWPAAEREFQRALELDSNDATAHHWYAEHLAYRGRFDEAFREIELARKLDPLSLIVATDYGVILYLARQYDRAIDQFRSVQNLEPNFIHAHMVGLAYVQKGRFAEALADLQNWRLYDEGPWLEGTSAYIYGRSGNRAQAEKSLRKLTELTAQHPTDPGPVIAALIGMGNYDQAIDWLETAYTQHSNIVTTLKVNPIFDPLRSDPRFQELLRRLKLEA